MSKEPEGVPSEETTQGGEASGEASKGVDVTQEKLAEMINDGVKKSVAEERQKIEAHFQSIADRDIGAATREARKAQASLAAMEKTMSRLPAHTQSQLRMAKLNAQEQFNYGYEVEEAQRQQRAVFDRDFHSNMIETLKEFNIDPSDKSIDWATDAGGDYLVRQKRVLTSAAKLSRTKGEETKKQLDEKLDTFEKKFRQDYGLDSADTTTASGAGRGKKPSLEELQASTPFETDKKVKKGEWVL
jgi:Fe2+ transport system protein B|tara:strand:+ start:275 stop:1006 length:732 start_codon:yes stop_codon:yes gene_type:complete